MAKSVEAQPPLTRGHKKKSRTRQLLIESAMQVIAEQGDGFAIAEVAAKAGVSHGTFYNYFADRDVLLDAVVAHAVEQFAAAAAEHVDEPDPAARFAIISARALNAAARAPHTMRVAVRLDAVQRALVVDGPLSYLRLDLAEGYRKKRFTSPPDEGTLDVIVLRNVFERRAELGLLQSVGFAASRLRRMVMIEHTVLLVSGLVLGTLAAGVAVIPTLTRPALALPWLPLGMTLVVTLANGLLWTWGATRRACRGKIGRAHV